MSYIKIDCGLVVLACEKEIESLKSCIEIQVENEIEKFHQYRVKTAESFWYGLIWNVFTKKANRKVPTKDESREKFLSYNGNLIVMEDREYEIFYTRNGIQNRYEDRIQPIRNILDSAMISEKFGQRTMDISIKDLSLIKRYILDIGEVK
jgi:hypothetical protein